MRGQAATLVRSAIARRMALALSSETQLQTMLLPGPFGPVHFVSPAQ